MVDDSQKAEIVQRICEIDATFPDPGKRLSYGTAGFRANASLLERASFRVGLTVALRAMSHATTCGVMITASHNHHVDNGVKIIEPDGSLLAPTWETLSELIVNSDDMSDTMNTLRNVNAADFPSEDIVFGETPAGAKVFLAMDTRLSSPTLIAAIKQGLDCLNVQYTDFGLLSTPQLVYLTACSGMDYQPSNYIENFTNAFREFMSLIGGQKDSYQRELVLDCANGVGALPMHEIVEAVREHLEITLINTNTDQPTLLNENCGAEYVHKEVRLPAELNLESSVTKVACFDGDADRLIYFKRGLDDTPQVIDGDKQFALLMMYVVAQLEALGIKEEVSHCLVNTAYSNSSAQKFIRESGITTVLVPTGVKNAHPVVQKFVIGAGDEPNGHGTICVKWDQLNTALEGKEDRIEAKKLRALLSISNVYVGDAVANLLMCEAVLCDMDFSVSEFADLYSELPNKMFKAVVANRTGFRTIHDESKLIQPIELQNLIEEKCAAVAGGRAFVRPSGTEDILRLYVEAERTQDVDSLAREILEAIEQRFKNYQGDGNEGSINASLFCGGCM